jgi:hypothetical protein
VDDRLSLGDAGDADVQEAAEEETEKEADNFIKERGHD